MNNLSDIYTAIKFIEDNLKNPINIGDVAAQTGYSKYHFTRVFKDVTGYKPSDYLRGRKVSQALIYMKSKHTRVIDAAFEFGFNSPEVFTRSCLSSFGQSPSQIKAGLMDGSFKGLEALTMHHLLFYNQYAKLQVSEETLPSLLLKGFSYMNSNFLTDIDFTNSAVESLLQSAKVYYHLHWVSDMPNTYHHLLGIPMSIDNITEEDFTNYVYKQIPEGHYLNFPIGDRKEIHTMNKYVYDHFLPRNEYLNQRTYAVEVIRPSGDQLIGSSLLYVPVKRKKNLLDIKSKDHYTS